MSKSEISSLVTFWRDDLCSAVGRHGDVRLARELAEQLNLNAEQQAEWLKKCEKKMNLKPKYSKYEHTAPQIQDYEQLESFYRDNYEEELVKMQEEANKKEKEAEYGGLLTNIIDELLKKYGVSENSLQKIADVVEAIASSTIVVENKEGTTISICLKNS